MTDDTPRILMGHGSGGLLTARLVREIFVKHLGNPALDRLDDAARLPAVRGELCLTTDAFVVDPLCFPGGDIGELAVCGTVNDLWVAGARPMGLSAAFVLEEGLELALLERLVQSMARAARQAGVAVVCGDTKVVPRGKGDGCYITTAGVGERLPGLELGAERARPGDRVLVSGPVGQHGAAVMAARLGLDEAGVVRSDCAPLSPLLEPLLARPEGLHAMRDPTRGGLGTTLCELAEASAVTLEIAEAAVPVEPATRTVCELVGLDPLMLACEGRAIVIATPMAARRALALLRTLPGGEGAAEIGEVVAGGGRVVLLTAIGGRRLLTVPASAPLPRIC